jgi:hypothetical protein
MLGMMLGLLVGLAAAIPPGQAAAKRARVPTVAVADIAAHDGNGFAAEALRLVIDEALREVGGIRVTTQQRATYIVRGSITELKQSHEGGDRRIDCQVSIVVSDAQGGAMRLLLAGRGAARGKMKVGPLARQALTAAVRSALKPMGNSLVALR